MHRFLGVDAIVFVEGGRTTYTLEQTAEGSYNSQGEDLKYWQIIFMTFAPKKNFNLRALGSKTTIREIASLIAQGEVRHVCVAMDRDFDHLTGALPNVPGVFY